MGERVALGIGNDTALIGYVMAAEGRLKRRFNMKRPGNSMRGAAFYQPGEQDLVASKMIAASCSMLPRSRIQGPSYARNTNGKACASIKPSSVSYWVGHRPFPGPPHPPSRA